MGDEERACLQELGTKGVGYCIVHVEIAGSLRENVYWCVVWDACFCEFFLFFS